MKKSLKINYMYNLLYQITAMLIPLITVPYVSRVLGVKAIGINSYTNANIQYFVLLGSLGIGIYATKKIATVRENKELLKKTFFEIFTIQCLGCLLAYGVFIVFLGTSSTLRLYYILQSIFILASAIDISWYFLGVEDFKKASLRNFMVKIISVILIFTFVNSSEDLWRYIFINSGTMFVGQLVMWRYIDKSFFKGVTFKGLNSIQHIRPVLIMFIPQIATQVYMVMDKTMTGIIADTIQVGYYDQSQKIVRILLAIVTSLGMVMLPRIANLHSNGESDKVSEYLQKAFQVISFLALPLTFGLLATSDRFIPMFFGNEYMPVIQLVNISSFMIIVIGLGNVFGTQYMLAIGKNKEYTISVIIGAIINFTLNLILIPRIQAVGAVISTLTAESTIAIIQFYFSRKIFNRDWIKCTYKYWVAAIIMFLVVRSIAVIDIRRSYFVFIQIFIGAITYFTILFILADKMFMKALKTIRSKV